MLGAYIKDRFLSGRDAKNENFDLSYMCLHVAITARQFWKNVKCSYPQVIQAKAENT